MSIRTILQWVMIIVLGCINTIILSVQQPVAMPVPMTSSMPVAPNPAVPVAGPVVIPSATYPVGQKSTVPLITSNSSAPLPVQTTLTLPVSVPNVINQGQKSVQNALPTPVAVPQRSLAPNAGNVPQVMSPGMSQSVVLPSPVPSVVVPSKAPDTKPLALTKLDASVSPSKEEDLDEDSQDIGLSTIDLEEQRGNWLKKRLWWERAENRFEKIRALIDAVWSLRSDFFSKRTELDKTVLDPFYLFIGAGQGEFREIIADIIKRIQKAQQVEGDLDEQERALLVDLQDQKKELDAMQKSIDAILTLDHDVDVALSRLMEQLNRARDYEREAWQSLKDIARELSDKKAQEIFYHMETIGKNVKGVHKYIQGEFANHFNTLVKKITNEVLATKQILQTFKAKGIDLKDRADKLEQADRTAHDRALEKKTKEEAEQKAKEELQKRQQEEEEEVSDQSWIGWILSWPTEAWNNIRILIGW